MTVEAMASILILVSALLHATVNAMIKASDEGLLMRGCMNATALVFAAPLTLLVPVPSAELWAILVAAMLIHGLYPFFIVSAYRHGDLSATFPLARGIAPLGVFSLLTVLGGGSVSLWQGASVGLICVGVASFALEKAVWRETRRKRGALLAVGTGVIIAVYTTISGIAFCFYRLVFCA